MASGKGSGRCRSARESGQEGGEWIRVEAKVTGDQPVKRNERTSSRQG
jgi:hypothetical protein